MDVTLGPLGWLGVALLGLALLMLCLPWASYYVARGAALGWMHGKHLYVKMVSQQEGKGKHDRST